MFYLRVSIGDFVFGKEERKAIESLMRGNRISEGRSVAEFEKNFAKFVGTKYCVAANSGTSALMLSLAALKYHSKHKLREGTSIISSPLTYIATSNAIVTTGFKPDYVDINLDDFSINVDQLAEKLEHSKAENYSGIMPVHLMGYPCDMKKINAIEDVKWEKGFVSGAVYHGDKNHTSFLNKVYALNSQSNPLHSDIWPSAIKYESEIVSMTAKMLGADLVNNKEEEITSNL